MRQVFLGIAAICFLLGAAATIFDVILRWTTGGNVDGVIEITTLLIGFGALMSMPVCYEVQSHVAAKLLSEANPRLFARPLACLSALASLIFTAAIFALMAKNTWSKLGTPETTRDLQIPMDWALGVITLSFALSLFCAVLGVARAWRQEVPHE